MMPLSETRISSPAFNGNTSVLSHLKLEYCNSSTFLAAAAISKAKHFLFHIRIYLAIHLKSAIVKLENKFNVNV